jgi:adenylate cyclase
MGSSDRFDYSVIGETVNTAARAESACKHVRHDIVLAGEVDEATRRLAELFAGHVHLKGRSLPQPVTIIVGDEEHASTPGFSALRKEIAHIAGQLGQAAARGRKPKASLLQLLAELSIHQPGLAAYLKAMPSRIADFNAPGVRP